MYLMRILTALSEYLLFVITQKLKAHKQKEGELHILHGFLCVVYLFQNKLHKFFKEFIVFHFIYHNLS